MIIKKLIIRQTYQVKILLKFNIIIFYTTSKDNTKANILIHYPNDNPVNDYDNW